MDIILVADDNDGIRSLIKAAFINSFIVIEAIDGYDCIAKLIEHKPVLIIMDAKMPALDGVKAAQMIKNADPDMPIILISGYGISNYSYVNKLVDFIVNKPFELDHLRQCVFDVLDIPESIRKPI